VKAESYDFSSQLSENTIAVSPLANDFDYSRVAAACESAVRKRWLSANSANKVTRVP